MADNSTLPGVGDVIAADDIAGVKYQRIKMTYGDDGTAIDVSPVNPMPVSDQTAVAIQALTDTMLYMLSAILEKMPRCSGNDQAIVSIEAGTLPTVTTLTNQAQIGGKAAAQAYDSFTNIGALHIYNNITVS